MTLASKTDLETMNFAFAGQPFVQVAAKAAVTFDGMNIADNAQPMGWGAVGAAAAPARPVVVVIT